MEQVLIKTHQLTKRYGPVSVVKGLNLEVKSGEIFGFLGPNGSGKTTTIKMLTGLLVLKFNISNSIGINFFDQSQFFFAWRQS